MTVDEILETGKYTDRRGREWKRGPSFVCNRDWFYRVGVYKAGYANDAEMRLLIERDLHRDVCEGLRTCVDHPVPHVVSYLRQAGVIQAYPADRNHGDQRSSVYRQFPEAMDAARALAVGE